jgi:hypothetical protein
MNRLATRHFPVTGVVLSSACIWRSCRMRPVIACSAAAEGLSFSISLAIVRPRAHNRLNRDAFVPGRTNEKVLSCESQALRECIRGSCRAGISLPPFIIEGSPDLAGLAPMQRDVSSCGFFAGSTTLRPIQSNFVADTPPSFERNATAATTCLLCNRSLN